MRGIPLCSADIGSDFQPDWLTDAVTGHKEKKILKGGSPPLLLQRKLTAL